MSFHYNYNFYCADCGKLKHKIKDSFDRIERTLQCKDGFILEEEIGICGGCFDKRKLKAKPILKFNLKEQK